MCEIFQYSDNKRQFGSIGGPAQSDPDQPQTSSSEARQSNKPTDNLAASFISILNILFDLIQGVLSTFFTQNSISNIWLDYGWKVRQCSHTGPRLFIFIINLTFHLNSNQNLKSIKMTDDRSLESIPKFKTSTSVT